MQSITLPDKHSLISLTPISQLSYLSYCIGSKAMKLRTKSDTKRDILFYKVSLKYSCK